MLVLGIKEQEVIRIGDDIYVTLVRKSARLGYRLGIVAPRNVSIDRLGKFDFDELKEMKDESH